MRMRHKCLICIVIFIIQWNQQGNALKGTQIYIKRQFPLQRWESAQCFQQHTALQISYSSIVGQLWKEVARVLSGELTPQPAHATIIPPVKALFSPVLPCSAFCRPARQQSSSASMAASQLDWGWDQQLGVKAFILPLGKRGQAVWILKETSLHPYTAGAHSWSWEANETHLITCHKVWERENTLPNEKTTEFCMNSPQVHVNATSHFFGSGTLRSRTNSWANGTNSLKDFYF